MNAPIPTAAPWRPSRALTAAERINALTPLERQRFKVLVAALGFKLRDLTADDVRFLAWLARWDDWTIAAAGELFRRARRGGRP